MLVWFAIYETVEELYGRMPDELYSQMCNATYTIPMMARKFSNMQFFNAEFQERYANYLYTRPGLEIEKQWQAEHPEGTFNSK